MNFEQLLDGATKGPWHHSEILDDGRLGIITDESDIVVGANRNLHKDNAEYIARCNPTVMREVWAALKEADNALKDYIPDLEARGASLNYGRSVLRKLDRALALLDGQTEDKL